MKFAHDRSDHISILHIYKYYLEANNKYEFCRNNYINFESMKRITEYRLEYLNCLFDIGLITNEEYDDIRYKRYKCESIHEYRKDSNMIKCALTAGLYPNLIEIRRPRSKYEVTISGTFSKPCQSNEIKYFIRINGGRHRVYLNNCSVNFFESNYDYNYLLYYNQMKTSKILISDSTEVPPYPLLIFGGDLELDYDKSMIIMDGWMKFSTPSKISILIKKIRDSIDKLLLKKIEQPSYDLNNNSLISAIYYLVYRNGL